MLRLFPALVNAFKTNPATGLPLLDDFNQADVKNDQGLSSADPFIPYEGTVDPRLDWTVGRRGIPYLDWGPHPGRSWIRDQNFGGPYSPKKNVYYRAEEGTLTHVGYWAKGLVAINGNIIRFADVLLMAAECEIELGNLETARGYVNQIRRRAANTAGFVKNPDGSPAANYLIQEYTEPWADPENARKAVRFERRLELAMEGHRFYDLVRWGIAEKTLNEYLTVEGTKRPYLQGAVYRPHNAIFPIPQSHLDVINRDNTVFVQNPGY
jgi:starch-binding outer membrane protein, SusD/RagB family